ncbi:MAG: carbohydrate binding family 9 domain-containing protein [Gemmatimonadetes bacterium]|nr:carbohydrate binding family 9 domain-containing protein [Gemmatimonadota bacterium]
MLGTRSILPIAAVLTLTLGAGTPALHAQQTGPVLDGSPPPEWPQSITRDDRGRATVRAIRLDAPLTLDGRLDEAVYSDYAPFGDFVQVVPDAGSPATERTDVWVMFDDENIYVTCRCFDTAPPEEWVVNELRRDTPGNRNNEHFGVMFDTFYDRRSGVMFYANPLGARSDYSVVDEGNSNTDWNPVWDVVGGEFDGGWVVEMEIPFKSLRYVSGDDQLWGFQIRRSIRHKNEWTYLNPVPTSMAGPQGLNKVSVGGTLVGLELPSAGNNLELKPYAIGGLTTNRLVDPAVSNDVTGDIGLDLKYGLTANLTADVTVNTDFAQVEVDEQQVNLTRFSLFFPEKREFFLEGRGTFDFGQGGSGSFFGRGGGGGFSRGGGDRPTLFYSRRIGLDRGEVVPIRAGGRVTGKVGPFSVGAVNIQTGDIEETGIESTNYSVVRVKRDILTRSAVGALFTNRSVAVDGGGSSQSYGLDASFGFGDNFEMGGYWARTETPTLGGDDTSWQAALNYSGDTYGVTASHLSIGEAFNPEVGFLRRSDFDKSSGSLRFSPRPASISWIRKLTWQGNLDYFEDGAGRMESRRQSGRFSVEMESADQLSFTRTRDFDRLDVPFEVATDLAVPRGRYTFTNNRLWFRAGEQRRLSGSVSYQWGAYYHGELKSLSLSQGRLVVTNQFSLEPGVSLNLIDLPEGDSDQTVFRLRSDYAFSPRMFASALVQYNTATDYLSSNVRFRWEYAPGSELFVVWTDDRDTGFGGTGLRTRALAIKLTRLLRY